MIKIDKDIVPDFDYTSYSVPSTNPGPKSKYPFIDMVIGDSFLVEGMSEGELKAKVRNFRNSKAGKLKRFAVKYIYEEKGARCWLVGIDNEN